MAFDLTLGQSLTGTQLPTVPPNSTPEQQIAVINEIIGVLNNYSRDVVLTGSIEVDLDGSPVQTVSASHNLGYVPQVSGFLSGRSFQTDEDPSSVVPNTNIALPTFLEASIGGGVVAFSAWAEIVADAESVYVRVLNAGGFTTPPSGAVVVKYFLTRLPAI